MIIARPLVVGCDEIWRLQPPHLWGLPTQVLPVASHLAASVATPAGASQRPWLPHRPVLQWVLGLAFADPGQWASDHPARWPSHARKPQCSACRRYHPVLELLLEPGWGLREGADRSSCGSAAAAGASGDLPEEPAPAERAAEAGPTSAAAASASPAQPAPAAVAVPAQSAAPPSAASSSARPQALPLVAGLQAAHEGWCEVQDAERIDLTPPPSPCRGVQRQESDWSLCSFSSLPTEVSVELEETVDSSDEDSRGRERRRPDARPPL